MDHQNVSRFTILTIWYDKTIRYTFSDDKNKWFTTRFNLAIMCITMAVVSHSPPNYSAAKKSLGVSPGPVVTESFTHLSLYSKVIFHYTLYDNEHILMST